MEHPAQFASSAMCCRSSFRRLSVRFNPLLRKGKQQDIWSMKEKKYNQKKTANDVLRLLTICDMAPIARKDKRERRKKDHIA